MNSNASILELAAAINNGCPRTSSQPRPARRFVYDKKKQDLVEKPAPRIRALPKYPRVLYSLGGMAEDREKLDQTLRQHGVIADITEEGDPVAESDSHRRRIARALGYMSPDSFYD